MGHAGKLQCTHTANMNPVVHELLRGQDRYFPVYQYVWSSSGREWSPKQAPSKAFEPAVPCILMRGLPGDAVLVHPGGVDQETLRHLV